MQTTERTAGDLAGPARPATRRVLITGVGRSGTTWTGAVLGRATGAAFANEPDHPRRDPFGFRVAHSMGYFPVLDPDDDAPEYERLWAAAFGTGVAPGPLDGIRRRAARRLLSRVRAEKVTAALRPGGGALPASLRLAARLAVPGSTGSADVAIVKSLVSVFALDWICARWTPRVLVVLRHPLDVVASRLELGHHGLPWDLDPRVGAAYARITGTSLGAVASDSTRLPVPREVAFKVGALLTVVQAHLARHPDWRLVTHGWLCEDPAPRFRAVYDDLRLGWNPGVERFLRSNDHPGQGFQISRVATEQRDRWRSRLDTAQIEEVSPMLRRFPIDWSMFGGEPW